MFQVTEEPIVTEEPGATEDSAPAQTTTEEMTQEADVRVYATVAPPDDMGTGQLVAFDYSMTAGDRLIALLLTAILFVNLVHLIVDLWGKPRGATFVAEE